MNVLEKNARNMILMADVGTNGRVSDGGVFGKTTFCSNLKEKRLNLPQSSPLPGFEKKFVLKNVLEFEFRSAVSEIS